MATLKVNSHTQNQIQTATLVNKPVESPKISPIETILESNLFNFIIVLAVVIWLIKKTDVAGLIAKKRDEIIELIKNAENEKTVKQNNLNNTKIKVQNVSQEVKKISDEGEQVAKNLSENILDDAKKQAEDFQKKAESSVESQKQVVSNEIMTKITGAAFYIAEEHIKQSIDERLHRKYIEEFIDNLEKI